YSGGNFESSQNAGVSWTSYTYYDFMFEEWGEVSSEQHYDRSHTALLGLLPIASRNNVLARTKVALLGLKAIVTRGTGYWVSPTSHDDPDAFWSSETNAYDDNEATYAMSISIPPSTLGDSLVLIHAALDCSKLRFIAKDYDSRIDYIDLDVYYGDAWHDVYQGDFTDEVWVEKDIPAGTQSVTQARLRFHNSHVSSYCTAMVYEFDFWKITEGTHFERLYTALLGLKTTAARALSLGRIKTALLGLKPTGIRTIAGNYVREGIVYLGLKTTATRTVVLTYVDTALLGLKTIASRAIAYPHTGVALLGLKATAVR
ncbi:unnamed protein product, partial [marine sediment metagenome]